VVVGPTVASSQSSSADLCTYNGLRVVRFDVKSGDSRKQTMPTDFREGGSIPPTN